jgi:hypothetical protein
VQWISTNHPDIQNDQGLFILTVLKQHGEVGRLIGTPELVSLKREVGETSGTTQRDRCAGEMFQLLKHVALQERVAQTPQVVFRFLSQPDFVAHP